MNRWRLLWQTLVYFLPTNLAVVAGCAVGAAVLTGALLVGDSMRGSLRRLTLDRLGDIELVLIAERFFEATLRDRLHDLDNRVEVRSAAVIQVEGAVSNPQTGKAARALIVGVDDRFFKLFPRPTVPQGGASLPGSLGETGWINAELAAAVGTQVGDRLVVRFEKLSPIPKEALMGDRAAEKALRSLSLPVGALLESRGIGRYGLQPTQRIPRLLFVPRELLAKNLEQPGRANVLLISKSAATSPASDSSDTETWNERLRGALRLSDYGLAWRVEQRFNYLALESRGLILAPTFETAAQRMLAAGKRPYQRVLSYLANTIAAHDKEIPYSVVTALDWDDAERSALKRLAPPIQQAIDVSKPDDILLNQWSADRLGAKLGDTIRLDYFHAHDDGRLERRSHVFRLAGVAAMDGLSLDQTFTPPYPGITSARNFRDWEPPFPIDLRRIKDPDEAYWKQYRTAPKAFVPHETGRALWSSRFGSATSLRVALPANESPTAFADRLTRNLLAAIDPRSAGLVFQNLRAADLIASAGSTPFDVLFLSFSGFLIMAAMVLVGLLFRLNIERRAGQLGMLLACGLTPVQIRRLLTFEGIGLAVIGAGLGQFGALVFARSMIAALTTWWRSAVSTPFIEFHARAGSVLLGGGLSALIGTAAVWLGVRQLTQRPIIPLLRGELGGDRPFRRAAGRFATWLAGLGISSGLVAMLAGGLAGGDPVGAFFAGGSLCLVGLISGFRLLIGRPVRRTFTGPPWVGISSLGLRNAGRFANRSVLTASLIASATFVIVAVGLMRHGTEPGPPNQRSGDGGFLLVAETASPVLENLADPRVWADLGMMGDGEPTFRDAEILGFRLRAGEDASCLNIYQPRRPTLLGATDAFIARGGFRFAGSMAQSANEKTNPWRLLERTFDDGAIPAIGDVNTLMWSLKTGIGQDFFLTDASGKQVKLRIVAGLAGSIFQGQLLIHEAQFLKAFSAVTGSRFFLAAAPPESAERLASALGRALDRHGVEVETTAARIQAFQAVERTYMAAFQTLGGLGLVLGTCGLGAVLLRNALERRGELAILQAVGWSRARVGWLIYVETSFVLAGGLGIGLVTAILAVAPTLFQWRQLPDLGGLAGMVFLVLAAGLLSTATGAWLALRAPVLASLRRE